jgi:hypothetical protein
MGPLLSGGSFRPYIYLCVAGLLLEASEGGHHPDCTQMGRKSDSSGGPRDRERIVE